MTFVETLQVKEGVSCDVYRFDDDDTKDLGVVSIAKGHTSPRMLIVGGERTIEIFKTGSGSLTIEDAEGKLQRYNFSPSNRDETIELHIGEKVQWEAEEDLVFYEICYPPYQEGRYVNL